MILSGHMRTLLQSVYSEKPVILCFLYEDCRQFILF